ncbi:hypothetical protein E8E13_000976 [Curvularia kusanoi]|uniref:Uncharacterized protein n=1 Tax=Curvularia kusanoi TaxID=90978 RepID=A0A9P4T7C9_CURKU|nr:hypothetical protein E8E13_000976 [Curvularia kusanoi]
MYLNRAILLPCISIVGAAYPEDVLSFIYFEDVENPLIATIKSDDATTTSAVVGCPTEVPIEKCDFGAGLDVEIIGNTRFQASLCTGTMYASYGCDGYNPAMDMMTCTADVRDQGLATKVVAGSDVVFVTATIIDGTSTSESSSRKTSTTSKSTTSAVVSTYIDTNEDSTSTVAVLSSGVVSTAASSSASESAGAAAKFNIGSTALFALAGAAAVI